MKKAKTEADVDKTYSSSNTDAGGEKIGELGGKIDIDKIFSNLLSKDAKISEELNGDAWVGKVLSYGDWGLKNNKNTIFGVAWEYDLAHQQNPNTFFEYKNFQIDGKFNSADVGNYHAGYTGIIAGVSQRAQYTWAGLGEIAKGNNVLGRLRQIIFNVSPNGDQK